MKLYEIEEKLIWLDAAIDITESVKRAASALGACIGGVGFGCGKAFSDFGLHAISVLSDNEQIPNKTFEFIGSIFGENGQRVGSYAEAGYTVVNTTKHWFEFNSAVGKMDSMLTNTEKTINLFSKQTGPIKFLGDIVNAVLSK